MTGTFEINGDKNEDVVENDKLMTTDQRPEPPEYDTVVGLSYVGKAEEEQLNKW